MYSINNRLVIPRTQLIFPAHKEAFFASAARSAADQVIADLEDACPVEYKGERSRMALVARLNEQSVVNKVISFRPNEYHSEFFFDDLETVVTGAPNTFHSIVLPKVQSAAEIIETADYLSFLERRAGWTALIRIECLIETPKALLAVEQIAQASKRMTGLIFGIADFAAQLGAPETVEDQHLYFLYAKQRMVVAAKAYGLHAIDNVYFPIWAKTDSEKRKKQIDKELRQKNTLSARMGFDGTWVIHPQQVEIANSCFTPSEESISAAKELLQHYENLGRGSHRGVDGEMIDEASAKVARAILAKVRD